MSAHLPDFELVPATALDDAELLRPVLESAVRNPFTGEIVYEDVNSILGSVPRSQEDMERKYTVVAWSNDEAKALGMMSLMQPDSVMRSFALGSNPIELTNAYVLNTVRGLNLGRTLVRHLEERAQEQGHTEIILNSGPRFRPTGWPFWRRMYGEPVGIAEDYYGPGLSAPVWRKPLSAEE